MLHFEFEIHFNQPQPHSIMTESSRENPKGVKSPFFFAPAAQKNRILPCIIANFIVKIARRRREKKAVLPCIIGIFIGKIARRRREKKLD